MYLVNTSFVVDAHCHERWLAAVARPYVALVGEAGFRVVAFSRVIRDDIPDGFTYSLLVDVPDMEGYRRLTGEVFAEYLAVAGSLPGDSVVWFTTLMKKI